jgi:hypothetical protein
MACRDGAAGAVAAGDQWLEPALIKNASHSLSFDLDQRRAPVLAPAFRMTDIDAAWFKALAERYLDEAAVCDQMARATDLRASKEEWLRLAAEWTRLAIEADARSRPN